MRNLRVKNHICEKCGRKIKAREIPWCASCRLLLYLENKKGRNQKNNFKKMDDEKEKEEEEIEVPSIDEEEELI